MSDTDWTFNFEKSLARQAYESTNNNHIQLGIRSGSAPSPEAYATLQEITTLIQKFSMQMKGISR